MALALELLSSLYTRYADNRRIYRRGCGEKCSQTVRDQASAAIWTDRDKYMCKKDTTIFY